VFVGELEDGCEVDGVWLVREAERAEDELRLVLADRTGAVLGVVRERVAECSRLARPGAAVRVLGRFAARPRALLAVRALRAPAPGSFREEDLRDGPAREPQHMEADLRALVATVREPHLRALLERFLGEDAPAWAAFRRAPAAKRYHQAYAHGLLEHSLTVAQAVSAVSAIFPGIDRDVAVCGALLHDIGKLEAYAAGPARIDMTDAGRLQGEIALGYYAVRRATEELEGFPPHLAEAVLHIILAHHGALEHGSPVVPCTREATLVHFLDNLGGRLGSFDRLQRGLPAGERWSAYDRVLGGTAYFPSPPPERADRAA
jgi:3'-5' exoribonuclease